MNRGYIRIWRKVEDSGIMGNAEVCQLFLHLMLKASSKTRKQLVGTTHIDLLPGQVIVGRKKLAAELNSTERKIRTCLATLENMEIIDQQTTNKFTIVSFVNWGRYQNERPADDQQSDQHSTSTRPALDHKQECKKLNMEEEEKKVSKPARGSRKAVQSYDDMVDAYTRNQDLKTALSEFIVMRKSAKAPFTNAALQHTFKELDKISCGNDVVKIAVLNQSVQRGWQGVFPVKDSAPGQDRIGPSRNGNTMPDGRERTYESDFGALGANMGARP